MNLKDIMALAESEESAVNYLVQTCVLPRSKKCFRCKSEMVYYADKYLFVCRNKRHRVKTSIFKDTFFYNNKVGVNNVFMICYLYLHKVSTVEIAKMLEIGSEAVTAWCEYLRELVADSLEFKEMQIGGEGVIVEVDETKLGKRKYNRRHIVNGVGSWWY